MSSPGGDLRARLIVALEVAGGGLSLTREEAVDAILAVLQPPLDELQERAETAEAANARVRELGERWAEESHPTHDHLCPDDVRRQLLAALNDTKPETGDDDKHGRA